MVSSANVKKGGEVSIVMVYDYCPSPPYLHDLTRLSSLPIRQVLQSLPVTNTAYRSTF